MINRPIEIHRCNTGPRPMLQARVKLSLRMWRYASMLAAIGDFNGFACYVVPCYSGGDTYVAVDGKLRWPQAFGARGEPWAQVGEAHCIVELDAMAEPIEVRIRGGWILLAEPA